MGSKPGPNPFDTRFGHPPFMWAGRHELLADIDTALARKGNKSLRQLLLTGPRGAGKTALINEWHRRAHKAGWSVVSVTPDLLALKEMLIVELDRMARKSRRRGLLFLIDEAHRADAAQLRAFGNKFQSLEGRYSHKNFALVVAGLDHVRDVLSVKDESTFFRPLKRREVRLMTEHTSEWYLRHVLAETERDVTEEALDLMVTESGGWPHAMQLVGHYTVGAAGEASTITVEHVESVVDQVRQDAGNDLLEISWHMLPVDARAFLSEIAARDTDIYDVAALQSAASDAGITNTDLVAHLEVSGFIRQHSSGDYKLAFPFVREWVRRKRENGAASSPNHPRTGSDGGDAQGGNATSARVAAPELTHHDRYAAATKMDLYLSRQRSS